jgi:hypothetical protein
MIMSGRMVGAGPQRAGVSDVTVALAGPPAADAPDAVGGDVGDVGNGDTVTLLLPVFGDGGARRRRLVAGGAVVISGLCLAYLVMLVVCVIALPVAGRPFSGAGTTTGASARGRVRAGSGWRSSAAGQAQIRLAAPPAIGPRVARRVDRAAAGGTVRAALPLGGASAVASRTPRVTTSSPRHVHRRNVVSAIAPIPTTAAGTPSPRLAGR